MSDMPRISQENRATPVHGRQSSSVFSASRILPVAAWGAALFFLLLAVLSLISPTVSEFLSSKLVFLLSLFVICSAGFAILALGVKRLPTHISAITRTIQEMNESDTVETLEFSPHPELVSLTETMNRLLSTLQIRQRASIDLLASNRVLARELTSLFHMLDSVNDGILAVDTVEKVVFANRATAPFLNVSPSEAQGMPVKECIKDPAVLRMLKDRGEEDTVHGIWSAELPPDEESGRGHVAIFQSHGFSEHDVPVGQVLLFRDINRIKNMEKLQTEFVDSVAHELRTPLTSIRAYAELLIDDEAADQQTKHNFYNIIYEETYRLSQLIDNLLNISMMESGSATLDIAPARIRKLLVDCLEVLRPQCEKKKITLIEDLPDRLPTLDIDKSLFNVAVMNVLGNAVKYTPEGGSVVLSTSSEEEEILINVRDTGVGISEEELPRIFDKFFRGASSSVAEVPGSGVGLATARQILRLHGGDIRVTSEPGEGSQFSIVLPRSLVNTSVGD